LTRALDDEALLPLVDALAPGAWLSGEALAAAAGVSRAALAKRIDQIEAWGLDIEARPGLGYRLAAPLERLDDARILAALAPHARAALKRLDVALRVDSTNQQQLHANPDHDPQALFAEAQTAGRGRRGRDWRSPFGANLYLSLGWSFPAWPPALGTLPLAVGVACATALAGAGVPGLGLKWPNDLRVGNDKPGGILIEQRGEFGGACRVVIGIGLNVAMTAAQAADVGQPWTSVQAVRAAHGLPPLSRNVLAAALLDAVLAMLDRFQHAGFAPFVDGWNRFDIATGRRVRIDGSGLGPAGSGLDGVACGIDAHGALIVQADDGARHHLHAGDVSLRLPVAAAP